MKYSYISTFYSDVNFSSNASNKGIRNVSLSCKGQGSRRDKIGPVTKINEIWQYCMCMSSVTENDTF